MIKNETSFLKHHDDWRDRSWKEKQMTSVKIDLQMNAMTFEYVFLPEFEHGVCYMYVTWGCLVFVLSKSIPVHSRVLHRNQREKVSLYRRDNDDACSILNPNLY